MTEHLNQVGIYYGPFTPKIFYIGWTSDDHRTEWVLIQYYTVSHTPDAERMEIGFRQDPKCHVNKEKYMT